jgi:hypothetical protein
VNSAIGANLSFCGVLRIPAILLRVLCERAGAVARRIDVPTPLR